MTVSKILKNTFLLILLLSLSSWAKDYKLYFLGGQSNMEGHGTVSEIPRDLNKPVKNVMIFTGNTARDGAPVDGRGIWASLRPGFGAGFKSDGKKNYYSGNFGPEFTFGLEIEKLFPGQNIAIIKYSRGGSSIDIRAADVFGCWDPDYNKGNGVNQYDHFLATLRNAFAVKDIDGDGKEDNLIPSGIVWMQGESDANLLRTAVVYEKNLKRLMNLIRAALRVDDLPVVIGRISDSHTGKNDCNKVWKYGDIVRAEQENFVKHDANAAIVRTTDSYKYSDHWHYDTEGYLDLGKQFAKKMFELEMKEKGVIK
jgi:hypothetical protein